VDGEQFFPFIFATRPEETAQAIFAFSRNDVDVKVRDALADNVVDCNEGAFRLHGILHFTGELLGIGEKRTDELSREIEQRWVVGFGDQQDVARKERPHVEKGRGDLVFENDFGFNFASNNLAERAGLVSRCILSCISLLRPGVRVRFFHVHKINLTELLAYRKIQDVEKQGIKSNSRRELARKLRASRSA
jgi:hypothetical protein